jgi:hypothetical protein
MNFRIIVVFPTDCGPTTAIFMGEERSCLAPEEKLLSPRQRAFSNRRQKSKNCVKLYCAWSVMDSSFGIVFTALLDNTLALLIREAFAIGDLTPSSDPSKSHRATLCTNQMLLSLLMK